MRLLKVFPRKTNATPFDENSIINRMPNLFDQADEIHISVTFTWDIPRSEKLYNSWKHIAPTKIGGPAFGAPGENFTHGLYLKNGYTITSRGCNNKCWFCSVWKREPHLKELLINPGHIIQDDNLLACSDQHVKNVFKMLKDLNKPATFSGGIEAKLLKPWHIDLFSSIKLNQLFCSYDTADDLEPLIEAGKLFKEANITYKNRKARCYVLVGFPADTIGDALQRIHQTLKIGFFPFAMLWRDEKGSINRKWSQFQRQWANPIITACNCKKLLNTVT